MPRSKKQRRKITAKSAGQFARVKIVSGSEPAEAPRRVWVFCFLLLIAVFAVYSPVRNYPFIAYDDDTYVTENPHVQAGLSWATIRWSATSLDATNWHPLTWLSHALDCELFGLNAGWHHINNVLIHAVNVLLLFLLLLKATGARGRSFLVAGLFALHPFNVGSVAWIAERKNVLSTLFLLLTVAAYGWYARKPGVQRYVLVALLFALGLAAKPMIVTLPFALLLLDYWPLRRIAGWSDASEQFPCVQVSPSRLVAEKAPLLALSVASSMLTLTAQSEEVKVAAIPYGARAVNVLYSYTLYLWKALWPAGFSVYYPHPFTNPSVLPGRAVWATVAAGTVLLISATLVAWWQRRTRPYLITGWFWYLGTLVPVLGIVQVGSQGMADRYAYVPLMGIFVIVAWGGNEIAERFGLTLALRQGMVAVVLALLAFVSFRQLGYWKTSLNLWLHARAVTANNYYADVHIGDLFAAERKPEALQYYREAVQIAPWDTEIHFPLAVCLQYYGFLQEAAEHYELFAGRSADRHELGFAYVYLSLTLGELGDFDRVHGAFELARLNDSRVVTDMIDNLNQGTKANPTDRAYLWLGLLLEQSGQLPAARDAYRQALRLNPQQLPAQRGLKRLETGRGQSLARGNPGSK